MITYKLRDTTLLRELLGTRLLQFFVKGGGVQFIPPQLTSAGEFITVFQKDKNSYIKLYMAIEGPIYSLEKSADIQIEMDAGNYPKLDFSIFNCSIENPYQHPLSSIEIIYHSLVNASGKKVLYLKGMVYCFGEREKLIVEMEDSPGSFSINTGNDLIYQYLIEDCHNIEMLSDS